MEKMSVSDAPLVWIRFILHQTIHLWNIIDIISHFDLLKFVGHKMTEAVLNNDLNLSGKSKNGT